MGKKEQVVERYLKDKVGEIGGIAYKYTSPGRRNVPDKLCAFPTGLIAFVECKAEDGVLSKGQEKELNRLVELSQPVFVVSTKAEVDEVIAMIISLILRRREAAANKEKPSSLLGANGKAL